MAAGLLAVAGIAKLRSAEATRAILLALKIPSGTWLVRSIGLFELILGISVLLIDSQLLMVALAAVYAVFAAASVWMWRKTDLESCGCLGDATAAPGPLHFVVIATLALGCGIASVEKTTQPAIDLITPLSATALALCLSLVCLVYAATVTLTLLPHALSAWTHKPTQT